MYVINNAICTLIASIYFELLPNTEIALFGIMLYARLLLIDHKNKLFLKLYQKLIYKEIKGISLII